MAASPSNSASLSGVLERIIFLNEENAYTIAEFRPDSASAPFDRLRATAGAAPLREKKSGAAARVGKVTIVGPLPGVQCGETLHLTGEWTRHSQHGDQFRVAAFKSELPSSVYGIRKYLGSGLVPGIGKVYAEKIVDVFGADTFRVLSEESARLRRVPGIGPKRATAIKHAWDGQRAQRELYIFLQTYGVTPAQCVRLVERYGAQAKPILLSEPYRVAREIDGIGFKTADRIAINLGFANDAPPRLDAGLLFALETLQEEGHTAYPQGELIDYAASLLETASELLAARLNALVETKQLVRHSAGAVAPAQLKVESPKLKADSKASPNFQPSTFNLQPAAQGALLQLPVLDRAERKIAAVVERLGRAGSSLPPIKAGAAIEWAQKKAGFAFHELQRTALQHALTHKFSILTGGPGTGKTTILRSLVEILKAKKVRVHLAAPTGRAAQRLAETTGGFASTIHRLLKYDAATGGFTANENTPLATDFLVVDEVSMLDARLAAALLQAVPARAHLLLVGDTDQLPSVGAGNVLKDLIAVADAPAKLKVESPKLKAPDGASPDFHPSTFNLQPVIPVTRLSVVYRQQGQSTIVTTAHAINSGDPSLPPAVNKVADAKAWSDLTFIAADSAEDCLQKIIEVCAGFVPQHWKWFDPVNDVQVLAPMHKGAAGVANLNVQLQAAFNGSAHSASSGQASLRGPSGEFRAGDKVIQLRNDYDKNLFNGDIGTVLSVNAGAGTLTANFDGVRHEFDRGALGNLALAYAISIHKSQGSEYPVVVIPLLKAHFVMLQRNLLYTAITRGKKKVIIVGEPAAYAMAVRNSESKQRCTHLQQKIAANVFR
ncbi:MAG TPA: AAA family ATPase [Opitutaceae bacterium]|nr:AAA family ATPase [Opitutaceae bacterium]